MKKFAFSLERVLGYKRQLLDLLKNELSALQAHCMELQRRIEDTDAEFNRTNRLLCEKMQGCVTPQDVAAYKSYLSELNRRAVALRQEKQKADRAVAEKQAEVVAMNTEIAALDHLKVRQFAEYLAGERKEQELFVEEFVSHTRIREQNEAARRAV
jgi:flagellar export protein FliJ